MTTDRIETAETPAMIRAYQTWQDAAREHTTALTARRMAEARYKNNRSPDNRQDYDNAKRTSARKSRNATAARKAYDRIVEARLDQAAEAYQTQPEQQHEAHAYATITQPLTTPHYDEEQTMHPYAPDGGRPPTYIVASHDTDRDRANTQRVPEAPEANHYHSTADAADHAIAAATYAQNAQTRAETAADRADAALDLADDAATVANDRGLAALAAAENAASDADRADDAADTASHAAFAASCHSRLADTAKELARSAADDADRHAGRAEEHRHYAEQAAGQAAADRDASAANVNATMTIRQEAASHRHTAEQAATAAYEQASAAAGHAQRAEQAELAVAAAEEESAENARRTERRATDAEQAADEITETADRVDRLATEARESAEEAEESADRAASAASTAQAAEEALEEATSDARTAADRAEQAALTAETEKDAAGTLWVEHESAAQNARDEARQAALSAAASALAANDARAEAGYTASLACDYHHAAQRNATLTETNATATAEHADRAEAARNEARLARDEARELTIDGLAATRINATLTVTNANATAADAQSAAEYSESANEAADSAKSALAEARTILDQIRQLAAAGQTAPQMIATAAPAPDSGLPPTTAEQVQAYIERAIKSYWTYGPATDEHDDVTPDDEPTLGGFGNTPDGRIELYETAPHRGPYASNPTNERSERGWVITIERSPDTPPAPRTALPPQPAPAPAAWPYDGPHGAPEDDDAIRAATTTYEAARATAQDPDDAAEAATNSAIDAGLDASRATALMVAIATYQTDRESSHGLDDATNCAIEAYHMTADDTDCYEYTGHDDDDDDEPDDLGSRADQAAQAAYSAAMARDHDNAAAWDAARDAAHDFGLDKHDQISAADRADRLWIATHPDDDDADDSPAGRGIQAARDDARAEEAAANAIQAASLARAEREVADRASTLNYYAREIATNIHSMTEEESTTIDQAARAYIDAQDRLAETRRAYGLTA